MSSLGSHQYPNQEHPMSGNLGKNEIFAEEVLVNCNSYELAAMFNILERKGLISKAEFSAEVTRLHEKAKGPVDPDPYVIRG
jgi:hypothetical protein